MRNVKGRMEKAYVEGDQDFKKKKKNLQEVTLLAKERKAF